VSGREFCRCVFREVAHRRSLYFPDGLASGTRNKARMLAMMCHPPRWNARRGFLSRAFASAKNDKDTPSKYRDAFPKLARLLPRDRRSRMPRAIWRSEATFYVASGNEAEGRPCHRDALISRRVPASIVFYRRYSDRIIRRVPFIARRFILLAAQYAIWDYRRFAADFPSPGYSDRLAKRRNVRVKTDARPEIQSY